MSHRLTFFGHSAFRIDTEKGLRIWIDPWLDNPLAPKNIDSKQADLILITHAHGDHFGNAPSLGKSPGTEIVTIHELQQYLLAKGLPNVTGMNIGGTYTTKGISITMVQAVHSSSIQEGNGLIYGGDAAGFIVRLEDGLVLYHAGDTALFGDMALIQKLYEPEVAILPIGSHYVMSPVEAAVATELLAPKMVIPMHYGTFPALTGQVEDFKSELDKRGIEVDLMVLDPGQGVDL